VTSKPSGTVKSSGGTSDRLLLVGLGAEDEEAHGRGAALAAALHAAVVDGHLDAEADDPGGQVIGDDGRGVGADAIGVDLLGDSERTLRVVLADEHGAVAGGGGLPLQVGQVAGGAIGHEQGRLDPVGPVAVGVAEVGDHQVELLGALEVGGELSEALLVAGGDVLGLGERLHGFGLGGAGRGDGRLGVRLLRRLRGRLSGAKALLAVDLNRRGGDLREFTDLRDGQASGGLALGVEVGVEVVLADGGGLHAVGGHLDLGGPDNRVQGELAETINRPVAVVMAAGEADAAAAVSALQAPHQGLRLVQAFDAVLIPEVDVLLDVLAGGRGGHEVEDLGAVRRETHVVVELVVGLDETGDAAGNGMVREGLEVGDPVGIHGPTGLERAADPRTVILFPILGVGVDGVVHEDDARALLG